MSMPKIDLALVILLFGIVYISLGIWNGELDEILQKAVVICLECIGIG